MLNKIPQSALKQLSSEGYFFIEKLIPDEILTELQESLSPWKDRPAINGYGCLYHSNDALLQNLALYSAVALKIALDEHILDLIEAHYGQKVILSKIEYRRALVRKPAMPLHCDGSKDLLVFIYLNGVDKETGMTAVVPGTHKIGVANNDGFLQVPTQVYQDYGTNIVPIEGGPGAAVVFEADIWHSRIESVRAGREIMWCSYSPISNPRDTLDLVFCRTSLIGLSERQFNVLGLRNPDLGNKKGEDFRLSKNLMADSIYLLPLGWLAKAAIKNLIVKIRMKIPEGPKAIIRRFLPNREINRKKIY